MVASVFITRSGMGNKTTTPYQDPVSWQQVSKTNKHVRTPFYFDMNLSRLIITKDRKIPTIRTVLVVACCSAMIVSDRAKSV